MRNQNNYLLIILIIVIVFFGNPTNAQDIKVIQDLNLWSGIAVEKSLTKKLSVSVKQEARLQKDITQLSSFFTQAGLEYDINKNFSLEGKYRYIRDRKSDGTYENNSRYSADLKYKGEISFVSIYYRLRYQKEVESMRVFNNREPFEKYLRHRITINYNDLKRIKPYISAEIFQHYELYEFPKYDKVRILAGIRYSLKSIGEFNFAYGINQELNTILPYTCFLIKINYTYKF